MATWGLLMVLYGAILGSVWMRVCRCRSNNLETKSSPLSIAIQELVATAGGIYLSLVLVVSFLKLEIPSTIEILHVSLDPLAFAAIVLSILQPLVFHFLNK